MKSEIIVLGAGGHASVIVDALIGAGHHVVAGLIDEVSPDRRGEKIGEATVLGGLEAVDDALMRGVGCAAVAIGDNAARQRLAEFVLRKGMELPLIQDPSATTSPSAVLGRGVALLPGSVVNAGAHIGDFCIINTAATVDHDCRIGQSCHLCPGVHLAGSVVVRDHVLIGTGAVVLPGIEIGEGATIGAGSVVNRDVAAGATVVGAPARPM